MNYTREFLIYLTSQQIPMPLSWSKALGLSIKGHSQVETQNQLSLQTTGFKLLRDRLLRGAVDHRLWSAKPDKWFTYMLQLYLVALRDIENKNGLPYLNLVYNEVATATKTVCYAPIIAGESYSLYGDTRYPVKITAYFTHTGEELWTKTTSTLSSNRPYIIYSALTYISEDSMYDAISEYLEFKIETAPGVKVAVLNGIYSQTPNSLLQPTEGQWRANYSDQIVLLPSLAKTKEQIASKLLFYLFDLAIVPDVDPKLLDTVMRILPPSVRTLDDIPNATPGVYDIDKVPDRRIL